MANEFQKLSGEYQRTGKEAISSMLRSAGDYRKSLEEISFEWAEFSKKSVSQAIEAQAQLTKKAFAAYISELTKFSMLGLYGPFSRDGSSEGGVPKKHETVERRPAEEKPHRDETRATTQKRPLGARATDCHSTREHAKKNRAGKNTKNEELKRNTSTTQHLKASVWPQFVFER